MFFLKQMCELATQIYSVNKYSIMRAFLLGNTKTETAYKALNCFSICFKHVAPLELGVGLQVIIKVQALLVCCILQWKAFLRIGIIKRWAQ